MSDTLELLRRLEATPLNEWLEHPRVVAGEAAAEIERLRAALREGIGAALNELSAKDLPLEWSRRSGIGTMLEALGCKSTRYDDAARAALETKK